MELGVLLEMAAAEMADRVAVICGSNESTYSQLLDQARRTAGWLRVRDVRTLALLDVNSEVVPALVFGATLAGVPFAPLNYRLADDRLADIARRLGDAAAMIVADDAAGRVTVANCDVVTRSEFERQAAASDQVAGGHATPDDVAILLFTSGTSGDPKCAMLRQRHLVSYVIQTVEFMGSDPSEAVLVSVPPYHIAGISTVLSSAYAGRRVVYLPAFDATKWVQVAREREITHAMLVPTMLKRVLDVCEQTGGSIPSLRHLAYGGGRMPLSVIATALRKFGPEVAFVNAYGLTETS
jgi:acyl-CoA synthetase (AMP-forming)/AMP-acid ligase II